MKKNMNIEELEANLFKKKETRMTNARLPIDVIELRDRITEQAGLNKTEIAILGIYLVANAKKVK